MIGGAFTNLNGAAAYGSAMVDAATGASADLEGQQPDPGLRRQAPPSWACPPTAPPSTATASSTTAPATSRASSRPARPTAPSSGSRTATATATAPTPRATPPTRCTWSATPTTAATSAATRRPTRGRFQRGMAFTKQVTGTLGNNGDGRTSTTPAAQPVGRHPGSRELAMGSYTGQYQAAWTVTGNDNYVVLGGEFPRVNGVNQQGIVRFAVQPISARAPSRSTPARNLVPTIAALGGGAVRVDPDRQLGPGRLAADLPAAARRQGGQHRTAVLHLLEPADRDRAPTAA